MPNNLSFEEKEKLAFELIDMAGWITQEIYGANLPSSWKQRVRKSFGMSGKGRPTESGVQIGYKDDAYQTNPLKIFQDKELENLNFHLNKAESKSEIEDITIEFESRKKAIYKKKQDIYPSSTIIKDKSKNLRHKVRPKQLLDIKNSYELLIKTYQEKNISAPPHVLERCNTLKNILPLEGQITNWIKLGRELGISRSDEENYLIKKLSNLTER